VTALITSLALLVVALCFLGQTIIYGRWLTRLTPRVNQLESDRHYQENR